MIWQQSFEMARRSVLQTLRQPAMVVPSLLAPRYDPHLGY